MVYADKRIDNLILMNQQSALRTKESDFCHHYLNNDGKIYSDKISKLVCKIDKQTNGLVISRLSQTRIFQHYILLELSNMTIRHYKLIIGVFRKFVILLISFFLNILNVCRGIRPL